MARNVPTIHLMISLFQNDEVFFMIFYLETLVFMLRIYLEIALILMMCMHITMIQPSGCFLGLSCTAFADVF